jgi:hypothetical protein
LLHWKWAEIEVRGRLFDVHNDWEETLGINNVMRRWVQPACCPSRIKTWQKPT